MRRKLILNMIATTMLFATACNNNSAVDDTENTTGIYTEIGTETETDTIEATGMETKTEESTIRTVKIDGKTYSYTYATIGTIFGCSRIDGMKYTGYQEEILLTPLEGDTISIDNECIRYVFSDNADISSASLSGYSFEAVVEDNSLVFTAYADYDENISEEEENEICKGLKDFLRDNLVGFGVDTGDGVEDVIPSIYLSDIK